ncbi:MAG: nicotinamide riboside transporter PnuC [Oscillospiraceae bacterium]|nr:nicotinamide riboside transporter PnuC [Oscillospiraceae bacterium]
MNNPFKSLTAKEWCLWMGSLGIVLASNLLSGETNFLALTAAAIGITSLIFAAKGNAWSPILMIVFSILYGMLSFRSHYWGEMITYLGMTLPMAVWSACTWLRNPAENGKEVAIQKLNSRHWIALVLSGFAVTCIFYAVLKGFHTPQLFFSTVSITTSFLAAALTMLRSSYFALAYASNDIILIVLWTIAALQNPVYIPVVVNFVIFFFNDMYGFLCWRKRERKACGASAGEAFRLS